MHMNSDKIKLFMRLAGQELGDRIDPRNEKTRALGAQLLLSEVLEYVVHGLGVIPEVNGVRIEHPEALKYHVDSKPDRKEMLDGLADVAYTMFWNECAFGIPLKEGFELVCDNNLEKFVHLKSWSKGETALPKNQWDCGINATWPNEVESVTVLCIDGEHYAVGKDKNGKVRKPGSYKSVDLSGLLAI
jgi:hypothetical protein